MSKRANDSCQSLPWIGLDFASAPQHNQRKYRLPPPPVGSLVFAIVWGNINVSQLLWFWNPRSPHPISTSFDEIRSAKKCKIRRHKHMGISFFLQKFQRFAFWRIGTVDTILFLNVRIPRKVLVRSWTLYNFSFMASCFIRAFWARAAYRVFYTY